ncbi:MAG: cation transporter [Mariniphaga sp.]|nr:cation transporter [Mariniphaga sp.]
MSINREKLGYQEGIVSIIVNIILFFLKYWAGIVSGSIALIADAWHTLSDSISSLIVIIGVKLSSQNPDKKHPFGHGRWEHIASFFIGFLLAIVAYDFMRKAIDRISTHESANFGTIAIIVTILSILIKEGLAQYAFYIGEKTDNTSIKADAWHHRTDALSSLIVLVGILLKNYFWWIDNALGIIISLMLFYAVFEIIKDSISKLLGEKPSEELMEKIKDIVNSSSYPGLNPHHFHIHHYGTHKELTFHIKLDKTKDIDTGHRIATEIETEIREKLYIESTIHVEPVEVKH